MKEQYQLLLEKVIAHSKGEHTSLYDDAFICNRIKELQLNREESLSLLFDFESRKPSEYQYVEFYNHKLFGKNNSDSWWDTDNENIDKSNEQRILFLKQIISEL
jgi:hypothetical protein